MLAAALSAPNTTAPYHDRRPLQRQAAELAQRFVVASDGSIWFTDPTYGIVGNYEGLKAEQEQEKHNVYRVDPRSGAVTVVVDDFTQPNGLCFSPDEKKLYIIDSGLTHGGPPISASSTSMSPPARCPTARSSRRISRPASPTAAPRHRRQRLVQHGLGRPEGGRRPLLRAGGDLIGKIHLPETCANLSFGGLLRNRLYHVREHLRLRPVCQHPRRRGPLITRA